MKIYHTFVHSVGWATVLGAPYAGATCEFSGPRDFAAGDVVAVELDLEVLKLLQEGHGGWDDLTLEV